MRCRFWCPARPNSKTNLTQTSKILVTSEIPLFFSDMTAGVVFTLTGSAFGVWTGRHGIGNKRFP